MALNDFLTDAQTTTTTLPSWYDTAQKNVINGGQGALSAAPNMAQTTAQGAINTLSGTQNPFTQAQGTLQQISSGAANPWITGANGQVTPNTNTALGGLFQAQNQQLRQLMPSQFQAPVTGANIASGNFGSLRGQTAVNKATADAVANINAQQLQAALTNQNTGYQSAAALGNVGQQGINAAMNVGAAQQNAPFQNIGNYASLLGTINAPTTVTSQKQLGGLGKINALGNLATGVLGGLGLTAGGLLFGSPATATRPATSGPLGFGGVPGAKGPSTGTGTGGTGGGGQFGPGLGPDGGPGEDTGDNPYAGMTDEEIQAAIDAQNNNWTDNIPAGEYDPSMDFSGGDGGGGGGYNPGGSTINENDYNPDDYGGGTGNYDTASSQMPSYDNDYSDYTGGLNTDYSDFA